MIEVYRPAAGLPGWEASPSQVMRGLNEIQLYDQNELGDFYTETTNRTIGLALRGVHAAVLISDHDIDGVEVDKTEDSLTMRFRSTPDSEEGEWQMEVETTPAWHINKHARRRLPDENDPHSLVGLRTHHMLPRVANRSLTSLVLSYHPLALEVLSENPDHLKKLLSGIKR